MGNNNLLKGKTYREGYYNSNGTYNSSGGAQKTVTFDCSGLEVGASYILSVYTQEAQAQWLGVCQFEGATMQSRVTKYGGSQSSDTSFSAIINFTANYSDASVFFRTYGDCFATLEKNNYEEVVVS